MKKIMFGAMALISLSVAASAALTSSIPGITVTESSCDDGYIITSTREGVSKTVEYDSCLSDGIVVKDIEGNVIGGGMETTPDEPVSFDGLTNVTINGVEYYFPAGYTTPTIDANYTCTGGYKYTGNPVDCFDQIFTDSLSDGYLNLTGVGSDLNLSENQLTNVDGLANLTSVGGDFYLPGNQLTNVDGLTNLTSVGGGLYLNGNQLTNVDGLTNLTSVGGGLSFDNNPSLQDLSGLNNLESLGNVVYLDKRDYSVKLDANSYLCQNFATKVIDQYGNNYPTKSDICYE